MAFYLAGIPPVVGGLLLFLAPHIMTRQNQANQAQEVPKPPGAGYENGLSQHQSAASRDMLAVIQGDDTHL